jgi:hypothetical protein
MHRRIACAAGALLAVACSSGSAGRTATALEFCTTTADIAVAKMSECMSMAPAVAADAKAQLTASCAASQQAVDAGRAEYDRAKGAACAERLASLDGCQGYLAMQDPPADCRAAFTGKAAAGEACWSAVECASGQCALFSCPGTCMGSASPGQDCSLAQCSPGSYCRYDPGTGRPTCQALSDVGGSCPCRPELYCDWGSPYQEAMSPAPPTCKARQTEGFCQTNSDSCALGTVCTGYPVSACLPLVGGGASCGASAACGYGYYCDPRSALCAALPDVGQRCVISWGDTTARVECVHGWCDEDGTKLCQAVKAEGEACTPTNGRGECEVYCDPSTQRCVGRPWTPSTCAAP